MSRVGTVVLTLLSLFAFAGNSLLCRLALQRTSIDAASFTAIRLASGALTLWLIVCALNWRESKQGLAPKRSTSTWLAAIALFGYAACFSFAYRGLSAATGALLLFGMVQLTMISVGRFSGERFSRRQAAGFTAAAAGLIGLLLPGLTAPPLFSAALMLLAGLAWGIYSLLGKRQSAGDPSATTAGNFLRTLPFVLLMLVIHWHDLHLDKPGVIYAIASGALASGVGYVIWYHTLPRIRATTAATVQLSVPLLVSFGGILLLGEPITTRLALASAAIIGGIALVVVPKTKA